MSSKEFWDEVHSKKKPEEVSWHTPEAATSLSLIKSADLPLDAITIDIGAGVGFLVDRLLEQGFTKLLALDISARALAETRARLGERSVEVTWIVGNVLDVDLPDVDLWHDRAVFHFLTEDDDRIQYAELVAEHVIPDGYAVIATFAEDGPEKCSGLPVRRHTSEELAQTFSANFELVRSERETHHTPWGAPQHFNYVLLRRRS